MGILLPGGLPVRLEAMLLPRKMLTTQSAYREAIIEHLFLGALLPPYWKQHWPERIEVSRPRVDDAGYDLILEAKGVIRHVQLKASFETSKVARHDVHLRLAEKPSGCVVWVVFDSDFRLGPFYWFGNSAGQPLPTISGFPYAKATRADSTGLKKDRTNLRRVPRSAFTRVDTLEQITSLLFV